MRSGGAVPECSVSERPAPKPTGAYRKGTVTVVSTQTPFCDALTG